MIFSNMQLTRRIILAVSFLIIHVFGVTRARPPNILLILADDYGYHDVGYHDSVISTPNLDRLAYGGVRLENYYVQPICTPTRSQLMSGRYQIHTGLQHSIIWAPQPNALPKEIPTMADLLRAQGYATHAVGKWHLGFYKDEFLPTNRGFDSFFGYLTGSEDYYTHMRCIGKDCGLDFRNMTQILRNHSGYSTHMFAQQVESIAMEHAKNNADKPLFVYLPFQAVHSPLEVPEEYEKPYSSIQDKNRRTYAGMVSCMDEAVGNVTAAFEKYGLWNDTILVFSTDNGGQILEGGSNWPLRGWKGSLWEGGMKGVGFVHAASLAQKGGVNTGLVHVSDWLPTLLKQAGGSTSQLKLDGYDQWQAISEGKSSPRTEILHNIDPLQPHRGTRSSDRYDNRVRSALRSGDWKIITGDPGNGSWVPPPETGAHTVPDPSPKTQNLWLFNIRDDPRETTDLSQKNPEMVTKLLERLYSYNLTAVPCRYPANDPRSYPSHNHGVWGPWE